MSRMLLQKEIIVAENRDIYAIYWPYHTITLSGEQSREVVHMFIGSRFYGREGLSRVVEMSKMSCCNNNERRNSGDGLDLLLLSKK